MKLNYNSLLQIQTDVVHIFLCLDDAKLKAGDEILSVNGRSLSDMSHFVALNVLKSLPDGVVHLAVRRHNINDV